MKIGFLVSYHGQQHLEPEYRQIVAHLEKRGHDVMHSLDKAGAFSGMSAHEVEKEFLRFYKQLEKCDLLIVENSVQSTQTGWCLGYLHDKGKPVVILSLQDSPTNIHVKGGLFSQIPNMAVYEYTRTTVGEVLDEALAYMGQHIDRRFTIIFPSNLMAELELESHKHHVPKAVFIRQLLEKTLKKTHAVIA